MKNRVFVMSLAALPLACVALALAAGVNFTGTWIRDKAKSDPIRMGPGAPGGGGGAQTADMDITLVIKQTDNELQIARKIKRDGQERTIEQKFTLDGKENTNAAPIGRGDFTSKTKWTKDKLVTEGVQKMSTQRGDFEINIKDEYSLSADGKVLTIVSTRTTPMGEQSSKQIYTKE